MQIIFTMRYAHFEKIMSPVRMSRYFLATKGNTRKAMTLYRKNLQLTQELFTVIGCFEVALRNAIDEVCTQSLGNDWLRESVEPQGIFDNENCKITCQNIIEALRKLDTYSHYKLVSELGFGFWRFMFAHNQYNATHKILLQIFPAKPISSRAIQYNPTYVFRQLAKLNKIRNRMAHHEPICFLQGSPSKCTSYVREHYHILLELLCWMGINHKSLLYGLDHIIPICDEIDRL